MVNLTFGEQVKIILSRKGMTIKELAEAVERHTGKPMSRQNMTQRLGRDNFQEQDMRLIAKILGCQFTLSIMEPVEEINVSAAPVEEPYTLTRDITVGELVDMVDDSAEPQVEEIVSPVVEDEVVEVVIEPIVEAVLESEEEQVAVEEVTPPATDEKEILRKGVKGFFRKSTPVIEKTEKVEESEPQTLGEINPYTRKEYETNSVRMHPKKIGYIQVYDRETHQWTDMTEWAFLGYQERLKKLQGKDYKPPIYLD